MRKGPLAALHARTATLVLTFSAILDVRIDHFQPVHLGALGRADGEGLLVHCCFLRRLGRRTNGNDSSLRIQPRQVSHALPETLQQRELVVSRGNWASKQSRLTCSWLYTRWTSSLRFPPVFPSSACPIRRLVIPRTQSVVVRRASIVSFTLPMDEFSMGTRPKGVWPPSTEVKTSVWSGVGAGQPGTGGSAEEGERRTDDTLAGYQCAVAEEVVGRLMRVGP